MKYIINVPEDRVHNDVLCAMGIMEDGVNHYLPTGIKAIPYDESAAEQRGAEKAWELIKAIGKMTDQEMRECFGEEIIVNLSYDEARDKYEAWMKQMKHKGESKVGDLVKHDTYGRCVLLEKKNVESAELWAVLDEKGMVHQINRKHITGKTDKHFNEIADLLEKMRKPE